jgi:hypothetical protein
MQKQIKTAFDSSAFFPHASYLNKGFEYFVRLAIRLEKIKENKKSLRKV